MATDGLLIIRLASHPLGHHRKIFRFSSLPLIGTCIIYNNIFLLKLQFTQRKACTTDYKMFICGRLDLLVFYLSRVIQLPSLVHIDNVFCKSPSLIRTPCWNMLNVGVSKDKIHSGRCSSHRACKVVSVDAAVVCVVLVICPSCSLTCLRCLGHLGYRSLTDSAIHSGTQEDKLSFKLRDSRKLSFKFRDSRRQAKLQAQGLKKTS